MLENLVCKRWDEMDRTRVHRRLALFDSRPELAPSSSFPTKFEISFTVSSRAPSKFFLLDHKKNTYGGCLFVCTARNWFLLDFQPQVIFLALTIQNDTFPSVYVSAKGCDHRFFSPPIFSFHDFRFGQSWFKSF